MKKIKNLGLILVLLLTILSLYSCNNNNTYADKFKKVKVGMNIEQVENIMGEADEITNIDKNYMVYYWFIGANSSDDAQKKWEKGIAITYYCVIFYSDDYVNFKIAEKEDIITGTWGVS